MHMIENCTCDVIPQSIVYAFEIRNDYNPTCSLRTDRRQLPSAVSLHPIIVGLFVHDHAVIVYLHIICKE